MNISKKLKEHIAPKENVLSQGGTVIGMYKHKDYEDIVYVGDDMHTLCIGATRSGKTRTVVLESIGLQGLSGFKDYRARILYAAIPKVNCINTHILFLKDWDIKYGLSILKTR